MAGEKKQVGFRLDDETRELLEDIARASGYSSLQLFLEAIVKSAVDNTDPEIMRMVRSIQKNRGKSIPRVTLPKEKT